MTVYQVRDWDKHFENAKSRQLDRLSWVPVPNKQSGLGFSRIMAEPDGGSIYGVWHMLVGAVSQQCRPRSGWLTTDGTPDGHPLDTSDLALKFRRPIEEVARALEVLSSSKVGWLIAHEVAAECPSSDLEVTAECPAGRHIREGNGRERKKDPAAVAAPDFENDATAGTKAKSKAKPEGSAPNGGTVWGEWVDANRAADRKDPSATGQDTRAAKELAHLLPDAAERVRILRQYLADPDPWLTKQGHALRHLAGKLDAYRNGTAPPVDPGDPDGPAIDALCAQIRAKNRAGGVQ